MNQSDSGAYASEEGMHGPLPVRADPAALRQVRWLVAFALGWTVLAVASGAAASSTAMGAPCPNSASGGEGDASSAWLLLAVMFAAAALVTSIGGAVTASRHLTGTPAATRWIATFVGLAVVLPTGLTAAFGLLMIFVAVGRSGCGL